MTAFKATCTLLIGAVSALALAGCGGGADNIASPGEGVLVVSNTTTPTTPTTPTPGSGPAADCPTGFTNAGVIANLRNCQLTGRISGTVSLTKRVGTIYSLSGRVDIGTDVGGDGAAAGGSAGVINVDAGVVVFGSSGLDYLVVNRGSRINAVGSAVAPIIFTSRQNVEGTATDSSQGQWGGIVVLGRAPISDCLSNVAGGSAQCQQQIEGTTNAFYGGATPTDNSGSLQFLQVRYAGFELAPGNELNGISLGGVGSGTTINNIQVHNSSDDGIEWFGGTVNSKYLVLTGNDDDNLDTDLGYKGFAQFVIAVQRAGGQSGDSIIEADSNGNEDAIPRQNARLANFTFVHRSTLAASVNAILLRGGTDYTAVNGVVVSPRACLDVDGAGTLGPANAALDKVGPFNFRSVTFSCGTDYQNDGNVTVDAIKAVFEATGTNNRPSFTSTLSNVFVNGTNEAGVVAFNASTLGAFFVTTNYIGAVRDANDTWYRGWTCDSGTASFNSGASCTSIPVL